MNVGGGGVPGPGGKVPPGITGGPTSTSPHLYPQLQSHHPHPYPAYPEADAPLPAAGAPHPTRQTPTYPGYHDPLPQPAAHHGYPTFHHDADVGGQGGYSSGGGGGGTGGVHSVAIPLEDRLRVAASKGQVDKVHELLQAGAGLQPDREGRTALHFAAQAGHAEVCKLLVQKGCELNLQDTMGYTALLRACSQGLLEVVKVCLDAGCAVDFADENGNTALHEAAWHGFSKTVELLIKYNADVFRTNKSGFTALHLAAQNGHNETSRVLLYGGINPDLQNNYGDTALHTAARYGHAGVSRILISAKCKLNVQNKNGDTALHIAAALKRRKIAKILVESHVDVHIKNKQNETAADVARRKEHPEIILIITSLSRPHSTGPRGVKEVPGVSFKDDIEIEDGPVVCADDEPPVKPEKQEKEKRFFQFFKKKKKDKDKETKPSPAQPTQVKKPVPPSKVQPVPARPVSGFFSQYVPKQGTQYYRDLAGNVKQGPVGYIPLCQCQPTIHHIEKTMYQTKEELYDHIDASHQVLSDRLAQLDMRASQQVHALDHLTRERLAQERDACRQAIEDRLQRERHRTQYVVESYGEEMQGHIHTWLEDRLAEYGHCLDHHHDDLALPPRHIFTDVNVGPDGGRLFRSRSDETLSVSDYSGKGRKRDFYASRKAAMEQIRGWKVPGGNTATLPAAGGPVGGVKVTGRRAERERGRSTDNVGGRDGRESRGPGQTMEESKKINLNSVSGAIGGSGGAMVRTTVMSAGNGKIITAAEVHKPGLDDRLADGASPSGIKGDSPQVRQQQERHVMFSAGPGTQGMQPSQGAVPKRSSSTQFHQFHPGRPDSAHFQGQPHQARSHGNLTSQTPPVTLATFGPSQSVSSPRRSILRSKTEEGALQERSLSASRSPLSPSTAQLSQANLEGRGPLGENTGLNFSGLHHPRGDPYNETTQATPAAGRFSGASGGAAALSLPKAGGSSGAVSGSNYHYQHNPLYGTAQSVGDIVKQWGAVESESLRSRPRTRSTDAVLDNADEGGIKFRSHSEERVLDHVDKSADLSSSKRAELSGYVTDSAVRPSYVDNSNQRYGFNYNNNSAAVSYRPIPPKRNSQYMANNNTNFKPDGSGPPTALSTDRLDTRLPATESDQSHRPSSSERQSGYYTDSDLRQGLAGNYLQKNAAPSFKAQDQLVSASRQAATRYRVLPPLPPGAAAERTYPKVAPKPTLAGNPAAGPQNVYEQSRPSSAGGQTSYDRSMSPSTNQFGYDRSKSPAVGNQPVFDRARSQTPTGKDSSAAIVGRSGLPGRGFSQASQGHGAPGQIMQPGAPGSQSYGQHSKPPTWSVLDSPRDRPGNSSSGQPSLRTQSPYQTVAGVKSMLGKPETSATSRTDTAPQTAIPSGHYSVTSGCLQHDTYTYSPATCSNGGGGKEDSTCSSNQDSGYSGRMAPGRGSVGGRSGGDSAANTPSSSFSTDRSLSLGTPGNSHAGSPYLHLGAGGRDGNSYSDYVPIGSTSSGGSNPQEDLARTTSQQYSGSFKGYAADNSYHPTASLPQAVYARTSTSTGNAPITQSDYPKTLLKSAPPDFPSASSQQQFGTTPSTPSQAVEGSNAGGYSSNTGFYGNGNGSGSYGNGSGSCGSAGNVQKQVQGWYQQKLLEAAQRLRNSSQYSAQQYGDNGALKDSAGYSSGLAYSGTSLPIHYDPVHGSDV